MLAVALAVHLVELGQLHLVVLAVAVMAVLQVTGEPQELPIQEARVVVEVMVKAAEQAVAVLSSSAIQTHS
jgi:hypothetical protein